MERHVVPWLARIARGHGGFDVSVVHASAVVRADAPARDGTPARWAAAVAAADAVLFVVSDRDTGLVDPLVDLAGGRDRGWRLKPVAIARASTAASERVAGLLRRCMCELNARPLDADLAWPDPTTALRLGADAAEATASATVTDGLDQLRRAHQSLRAFRPLEVPVLRGRR